MSESSARALWRKLDSLYQSKSLVNKLFLRKKLYNLRKHEGDSFSTHLNEFNTLIGQLVSIGVKFEDDDKAITLICSLPDSWDNLIVVNGGGDKELSYETLCTALLSEETRRRGSGNSSKEALAARGRPT
ncbi:retrovirus-related pol polyprotein from transposon tnt 1-94 [Phtheirospermum japonicum]|uniref:Retrovirus-related pol polyprotein from transposon tnt 1-94 n=1 Tax=Phtheirospermum japonicum TaxID=374723 RepID=A0A830BPI2_9LAMI|nr:retrovirus-related pol polyprotein from transposon tnt 1-94 [Phtheirospermum japonicum]